MLGYITTVEMAERWNVSTRQIQLLCKNGRIENAFKFGGVWVLPENTIKPTRTGKQKPGRKPKE